MDANNQKAQSLDEIQTQLAAAIGITDPNDEKQIQLLDKAVDVLFKKIFLDIVERLSDEDNKTYSDLLENQKPQDEIAKFLDEKIPGRSEITQKIVDEYIAGMKSAVSTA